MDKLHEDIHLNNELTGDGKGIVEIWSLGFEPFLTPKEDKIFKEKKKLNDRATIIKNSISLLNNRLLVIDPEIDKGYYTWINDNLKAMTERLERIKNLTDLKDEKLRVQLCKNKEKTRQVHLDREVLDEEQRIKIAIFESDVVRKLNCKNFEFTDKLVTVTTYYTEIFYSIMHHGFIMNNNKYVFFTAGAGATRNKKSSFIKENVLRDIELSLFCGLTIDEINKQGGMNTNKFLAYTALGLSNTQLWKGFDISKAIVVDDIEYSIPNQKVRYIYTQTQEDKDMVEELQNNFKTYNDEMKLLKTYKDIMKTEGLSEYNSMSRKEINANIKNLQELKRDIKKQIKEISNKYHTCEIKEMPVDIPFTDGFGLALKEKGSFMVRLPFVKGLISHVPYSKFKKWCKDNGRKIGKVTDIYGKEYDIDKNGIEYIFTKSQFKMHKYYNNVLDECGNVIKTGWEVYQENFKKYNCSACITNLEDKHIKLNAKSNYQVLQTLTTEMTDDDIVEIIGEDIETLKGIGNDYKAMLKILNADEKNAKMSPLQMSLIRYPEMLKDQYVKNYLKNMKKSVIKKLRSGKVTINGAYTFIIPDPVACLQWWLLGERDLKQLGFIHGNNVRCALFDEGEEVDCLRSPHLDHAHCIRTIIEDADLKKWYPTNGLYVGVEDTMSKFLVYDNDGDKSLVHNNKTIIKCAKQFQEKYGMIPNYYEMAKARPELLTNDTLFNGMLSAYHHGNIGSPSNEITKIFAKLDTNSTRETVLEAIEVVALRCADVNFVIDYAKTLFKPELNKETKERYKKYGSKKVPYFFKYAKDKRDSQVESRGSGNIDRIKDLVPDNRIHFKDLPAEYDYSKLMSYDVDTKTEEAKRILEMYKFVNSNSSNRKASSVMSSCNDERKKEVLQNRLDMVKLKQSFIKNTFNDEEYIANVLVKGLRNEIEKDLLWAMFGERIYGNICSNIPSNTKLCEVCGERFEFEHKVGKPEIYCSKCKKAIELEKTRNRVKKYRENN